MNEKTLVLTFKKSTGAAYSFSVPYPNENMVAEDVKALGEAIITHNLLTFKDGATLASLESAYVRELSRAPIAIA